jgi:hypothetical protein
MLEKRLKELLDYDRDTGVFTWKIKRGRSAKGSIAGCQHSNGRVLISIDGKLHWAHRLAWLYGYGEISDDFEIDHINRCGSDNRLVNLRKVSRKQNQENLGLRRDNSSGNRNVGWSKDHGKWTVNLKSHGKNIHFGYFSELSEAVVAARKARDETFTHHTE